MLAKFLQGYAAIKKISQTLLTAELSTEQRARRSRAPKPINAPMRPPYGIFGDAKQAREECGPFPSNISLERFDQSIAERSGPDSLVLPQHFQLEISGCQKFESLGNSCLFGAAISFNGCAL